MTDDVRSGEDDEFGQELGRRVAAAIISSALGVSLATQYTKFKDKRVSEGWVEIGRWLQRATVESRSASLSLDDLRKILRPNLKLVPPDEGG